jgi:hypothetical protein
MLAFGHHCRGFKHLTVMPGGVVAQAAKSLQLFFFDDQDVAWH